MKKLIYLDRKSSNVIKGILIVLIVFGHNHVLCPNNVEHGLMRYFYMFHIDCFFILPFFYNVPPLWSKKKIGSMVVRTWIPYFWICILCWLCFSFYRHEFILGTSMLKDFIIGSQTPVKHSFGFIFPWFLPTYCTFSILLLCARKNKYVGLLTLVLALLILGIPKENFYHLSNTVPFSSVLAIYYFGIGFLTFEINKWGSKWRWGATIVFVLLSICYWLNVRQDFLYIFFPVSFFLTLLNIISRIKNNRFLQLFGENSLGIYLFHMFLVNITYVCLPQTFVMGLVGFFISLLVSMEMTILIHRLPRLQRFLFPRNIEEFKSVFKND